MIKHLYIVPSTLLFARRTILWYFLQMIAQPNEAYDDD